MEESRKLDFLDDVSNNIYVCIQENLFYDCSLFYVKSLQFYEEISLTCDLPPKEKFLEKKELIKRKCDFFLQDSKKIITDVECSQILSALLILETNWNLEDLLNYFLEKRTNLLISCKNSKDLFHTFQSTILFSHLVFSQLETLLEKKEISNSLDLIFELTQQRQEMKHLIKSKIQNKIGNQLLKSKMKAYLVDLFFNSKLGERNGSNVGNFN
jgi:hypothetical protein